MCIAEQVPFEIPDSWEWVRLGNIITLISGQDMTPDMYNSQGKGIPYITGASNIENNNIIINRWTEFPKSIAHKGNLLLTCKGTVGTMAILNEESVHIARQIMAIVSPYDVDLNFIKLFLESHVTKLNIIAKSMIPGISRNDLTSILFPLPPINEQRLIVKKFNTILPCVNEYDLTESKIVKLNAAFPEQLKKSILQEAVQGKLVPQEPSDEPARVLLERIREEKARLIKEGKIKKDKNESVIFRRDNSYYEKLNDVEYCIDKKLPFEIPNSWCWTRVKSIASVLGGKRIPVGSTLTTENTGHVYIRIADMKNNSVNTDELRYVPNDVYPSISRYIINKEDLYITVAGTIGSVGKIPSELDGANLTENADRLVFTNIDQDWFMWCLSSELVQGQIADARTKVGQPKLAIKRIENFLIALPPLSEQQRIVAKIEQILTMAKCL